MWYILFIKIKKEVKMTDWSSRPKPNVSLLKEWICIFCFSDMSDEQIICCDTYKGKMTKYDFIAYYGDELDELQLSALESDN